MRQKKYRRNWAQIKMSESKIIKTNEIVRINIIIFRKMQKLKIFGSSMSRRVISLSWNWKRIFIHVYSSAYNTLKCKCISLSDQCAIKFSTFRKKVQFFKDKNSIYLYPVNFIINYTFIYSFPNRTPSQKRLLSL